MGNYLIALGRRLFRWSVAAVVAIPFYAAATLVGLPAWAALVAAFIGAILGSILAIRLTERLFGPEPQPAPPPPRGRGSGRRGASPP